MEITNQLTKLVSIQSEYPHEQKMGEYVVRLLKNSGYKVERQYIDSERFNVLAEKGTGKTSILLYAHFDTVGIVEGWETDPFKLTIIGDKVYGLGAWDMKAGLLANISAFQRCNPKNIKLKIVFCVDEEYISLGGHTLIKSPFMDDVACVISTEPAFQHGLHGIVTGRIGRAVYDGTISTKSRHFAFYEPRYDINLVYADLLQRINTLYKKTADQKQFVFVRSVESHVVGMSIPEKIVFQLDSSVIPPKSHASILKTLQSIAQKLEKKYNSVFSFTIQYHQRATPFLEPYSIENNDPYLQFLKKSVTEVTKKEPLPYFRSSVADENIFGARGITTLGIGPEGGNAHGANEWVSLQSIRKLIDILTRFISAADEL
ncbi:hypothetical protein COY90_03760 [Candidatus Roizmanbacteria bacterium CG_4_10_14_0_8_um_filter_39_9]|uniref:Peptidase M20 dimerisation domain-containing protein n=1 Tax=Candidatus Roizmanbacteria bacterium CG_4_10_14_0_8_um_filter_39_9 TaxID=1974829 RepID=A0A2M7QDL0_9BACT|nr:MAG: hypothetical protein COY90_03760 [Candidatus Roizmanbacteria bacterium CG_4_10_14_0_8_um_filter_39_9]